MAKKQQLDEALLEEYKELTDGEPVQPHWDNGALQKAITAIKKARGTAEKVADKVDARQEKNSVYGKGVTMTAEGKEAMLKQADEESAKEERKDDLVFDEKPQPAEPSDIEVLQAPIHKRGGGLRDSFDPEEKITVRAAEDIPRFWYGPANGGKYYGPFKKGTRLKAPAKIVQILEKGGKV